MFIELELKYANEDPRTGIAIINLDVVEAINQNEKGECGIICKDGGVYKPVESYQDVKRMIARGGI